MMKKFLFLLLFFSLISPAYSQDYFEAKHFQYNDQIIIERLITEMGVAKYIVYQTMLQQDSIVQGEDESKIVSFLIWPIKNNICIKLISKDNIYINETVINDFIFKNKNLGILWADKKENNLKFVPPMLAPFNSEIILYVNKRKKYFFELGTLHYYTENENKSKSRKEFLQTIKNEVLSKLKCFKVERVYKR